MNKIEQIAENEAVQIALDRCRESEGIVVDLAIALQQIAAPTFAEAQRAAYVESQFRAIGLQDVKQDELHNVYGRYPAQVTSPHSPVIVSAHSDTVFPASTDLSVRREGELIYGPGLGDNAMGVAGILFLARQMTELNFQLPTDLWFVANVGEEGLGDLRGMRAVVNRFGREATYIIVEGGLFGQLSHQAIGVRRFRIDVQTPGGHSWGSFGEASAVHELGHLITAIDRIETPESPKTTYNVGVIEGGTSVNTIAQSAHLLLDLRSEDSALLSRLVQQVKQIVAERKQRWQKNGRSQVAVTMTQIGNRPAGQIPRDTALVAWAEAALRYVGCQEISYIAGSTDANVPLSQGITAVCVGITESGNAHRLDEYINPTRLSDGLCQLLLLVLAASGFD